MTSANGVTVSYPEVSPRAELPCPSAEDGGDNGSNSVSSRHVSPELLESMERSVTEERAAVSGGAFASDPCPQW